VRFKLIEQTTPSYAPTSYHYSLSSLIEGFIACLLCLIFPCGKSENFARGSWVYQLHRWSCGHRIGGSSSKDGASRDC